MSGEVKNEDLSKVYSNRSVTNNKLNNYLDAIDDANCSLKLNNSNIKSFLRRAFAYKMLKNYLKAKND